MKKVIYINILIIIILNLISPVSIADTSETLQEQQKEFGINDFIEEANKYSGEFLEDININDILSSAISGQVDNQKIFNKIAKLFGKETINGLTALGSILAIIVIHTILKSISESLKMTI